MRGSTRSVMAIIMAVLFANYLPAQKISVKISGQVFDAAHKPAESATVILYHNKDAAPYKTTVADAEGKFVFDEINEGQYKIEVTLVGFAKYSGKTINVTSSTAVVLPAINLQPETGTLKDVSVTSQKPLIEQKIDRTVVNVNASISNTGATAMEVLEKSPGVQVDEDGNITFKGKTGVLVMIDDKPTYLSAADLATYLKSLPASALDKIELMDNPPAKYDAAGNAGVINIKTKKTKTAGFNGVASSSISHAYFDRFIESLNLNYHVNKINLFANASYNHNHGYRRLDVNRDFFDNTGNELKSFRQSAYFSPINQYAGILAGIDYYLSSKTTWGIVFNRTHSTSDDHRKVNSNLSSGTGKLDSMILANNTSYNRFDKKSVNLNFSHSFDSLGKTLTFDLDYINYNSNTYQGFLNNVYLPDNSLKNTQNTIDSLPSGINIYSAKIDYSQPLRNKGKIEAGLKSSYVNTDNAANYFNLVGNISSVDYEKTNRFLYNENINAAYINYNKEFKYFSFQTGLRFENTNGKGHQLGNAQKPDSVFTNSYSGLFPTAYLAYKFDTVNKHSLTASFGRRITRPNYQDLNPFVSIIDKFTYFTGNPFLRPQYSNNYQLAYHFKSMFTVAVNYSYATDLQQEVIEQKGDIFVSHTGNIGKQYFINVSLNANLQPTKWWTFSLYAELDHNNAKGDLNNGVLDEKATWVNTNMNSQFKLGKGWSAELSGFYQSAAAFAQFVKVPLGALNAGIQKKILKEKGTIKLSSRDIFHTIDSSGDINNIPNTKTSFHNVFDTQQVSLGFTYSFGSQTTKEKRKTGGADSEAQRAGN